MMTDFFFTANMAGIKINIKLEINQNQHENGHRCGINIHGEESQDNTVTGHPREEMRCKDHEICPVCATDFTQRQRATRPLPEL